ncbi:TPA: restriction endonuclease subunit S [Photobacterium damselae]
MSNQVPEGWVQSNLGTLVGIQSGNAFKSEDFVGYGIPVIRISNIKTSGHVSLGNSIYAQFSEKLERFKVGNGDILIAMSGATTGKVGRYKSNDYAYLNQRVGKFVNKNNNLVSMDYVHHITSKDSFIESVLIDAVGGAQPNISNNQIESIQVLFPPLPEQQKIAAILTSVDDVIEKTQAQINKLKDLKTGMMQELLTCGVGIDGKPHTEFKDSPVGLIPKSWDCVELDTLKHPSKYSCVGGPFGSDLTAKHYIDTAGVPVIRGTNIPLNFERFKEDNFVYVTEEKADLLVKNMAYQGDLVFTQRGTMGQVGLIPLDSKFKRYVVSQSQMKLTVNEMIVSSEFLYQFFLSNNFMKQLELETIATGLPHINLGILKAFKVPIPSLSEQNEIVDILTSIDKRSLFFISKLNKLKDLKKALMQDLLTGKVRVNVG